MKRILNFLVLCALCFCIAGCGKAPQSQIAATTLPVYEFTTRLCTGTPLTVARLITEDVSCLHDYTLQTSQLRAAEAAETIVISGGGLETFLDDLVSDSTKMIDSSLGIELYCPEASHDHEHEHHHEEDPHIWLSPALAKQMSINICNELATRYPEYKDIFQKNLINLEKEFDLLSVYAAEQLQDLKNREIITFHDGFSYMAEAFDLTIVHAIEEESGSEASAAELIELIQLVSEHQLSAVFTERNGSTAAAELIARETGAKTYQLDMCIAGSSYFDAMYSNIDTLKEALE